MSMSWQNADTFLKNRRTNKIEHNTYLERIDDETIGVRLYSTVVVKIHRDGTYTLNAGGYRTATTKDRINNYSTAKVFTSKGEWMVSPTVAFYSGIKVDTAGVPIASGPVTAADLTDKTERKILADWMDENGRPAEAALLRSRKRVAVLRDSVIHLA